jgi:hypothetical protein
MANKYLFNKNYWGENTKEEFISQQEKIKKLYDYKGRLRNIDISEKKTIKNGIFKKRIKTYFSLKSFKTYYYDKNNNIDNKKSYESTKKIPNNIAKHCEQEIEDYKKNFKITKKNIRKRVKRGQEYMKQGELKKASLDFFAVLSISPYNLTVRKSLRTLRKLKKVAGTTKVEGVGNNRSEMIYNRKGKLSKIIKYKGRKKQEYIYNEKNTLFKIIEYKTKNIFSNKYKVINEKNIVHKKIKSKKRVTFKKDIENRFKDIFKIIINICKSEKKLKKILRIIKNKKELKNYDITNLKSIVLSV